MCIPSQSEQRIGKASAEETELAAGLVVFDVMAQINQASGLLRRAPWTVVKYA
jgi:hypothetical protein